MTRLSFRYVLTNNQGKIIKESKQFNFSLSHYIYALYKRILTCEAKTTDECYRLLKLAISSKNYGNIYRVFTSNGKSEDELETSCFTLLRAFGYFAFEDILRTKPTFISYKTDPSCKKGNIFLSCPNGISGMSFHKSVRCQVPVHPFKKLYMTSFMVNNTNFSIVQNDGTYILSIVDPDFEQCEDLRGYIDFMDEKEKRFLDRLESQGNIVIKRNLDGVSFNITLSRYRGQELEEDSYTDGKILISTSMHEH